MMYTIQNLVRYGLYPCLLTLTLAVSGAAIRLQWNYQTVYGLTTLFLVVSLAVIERLFPLSNVWTMTRASFLRDVKYIAIDAPTIALAKAAFGAVAIYYAQGHRSALNHMAVWVEVLIFLLVFEFFQYWYHRLSHRATGRTGRFLWNAHVAHHLPDKVYVVMHAVFNPINALIATAIIQTPLILLGVSPEAVLISTMLMDLQSLVSHFNVDVRAGFFNYVFIGAETHRYHHSADPREAGNFGNTLAIWDIFFGTFYYRPGIAPERLGVEDPSAYPDSNHLMDVLVLPFRSADKYHQAVPNELNVAG